MTTSNLSHSVLDKSSVDSRMKYPRFESQFCYSVGGLNNYLMFLDPSCRGVVKIM